MDVLDLPFAREGLLELALLSIGCGLVGTWIVLRGLAFYAHAVGAATFPGLVLADGLGFATTLGAAGTGALCAVGVGILTRSARGRERADTATALVLCGALAIGILLASDVFASGGGVDQLLFGSLLLIDHGNLVLAAAASFVALAAGLLLEPRWVTVGFDPATAPSLGVRSAWPEVALLGVIGVVALGTLSAVGALLASALLVVPAATTRLVCTRLRTWQLATVALLLVEGTAGMWLSVETDAPPGATIAVVSGAVFAAVAVARAVTRGRSGGARGAGPRGGALRAAVLAVAALLALGLSACGAGGGGSDDGHVRVVATTTQVADLARLALGPAADVEQLLRPNTDPHDYEPRPSDVRAVADADVVLRSGGELDVWLPKVVEQSGTGAEVIDVGATVPDPDPHWWHDPRNAEQAVRTIGSAVARLAPPRPADAIGSRTTAAVRRIARADRAIARCIARLPRADRELVTDHDALGPFARRYGLTVIGTVIPARTTQAQPSAGDLQDLAAKVQRSRAKAVFPETSVNARLAQSIAQATGARVGEGLYADALGPAGSPGATYLGALQANADRIVAGLTGGTQRCTP